MSEIVIPKPRLKVTVMMTGGNGIEAKTDKYTEEELIAILNKSVPFFFYSTDENDVPVYVSVRRPEEITGFIIMDYSSYEKTMQRQQFAHAARVPAPGLVRS